MIYQSSDVMIRHDITWYDVILVLWYAEVHMSWYVMISHDMMWYGVIWRCDTALHPSTHIWNMSDTRWYRCDMSVIRTAIRSSAHQRRSRWYNVICIWYALINHDTTRISHDTTGFAPPHHLSFLRAGVSSSSESSGRRQCFTVRPRVLPPLLFFPPEIFSIMWFRLQRGFLLAFGWHFISSWVTSKMCAHMPDLRAPLQLHRNENGLAVHGTHEPVLQAYSAARARAHCAAATVCLSTRCVSRAYHDTYHNISQLITMHHVISQHLTKDCVIHTWHMWYNCDACDMNAICVLMLPRRSHLPARWETRSRAPSTSSATRTGTWPSMGSKWRGTWARSTAAPSVPSPSSSARVAVLWRRRASQTRRGRRRKRRRSSEYHAHIIAYLCSITFISDCIRSYHDICISAYQIVSDCIGSYHDMCIRTYHDHIMSYHDVFRSCTVSDAYQKVSTCIGMGTCVSEMKSHISERITTYHNISQRGRYHWNMEHISDSYRHLSHVSRQLCVSRRIAVGGCASGVSGGVYHMISRIIT